MDTEYATNLKIASKKHDLTGIRIYDKHEVELPNLGLVPMIDQETESTNWFIPAQDFNAITKVKFVNAYLILTNLFETEQELSLVEPMRVM